jgi:hypothetical protein
MSLYPSHYCPCTIFSLHHVVWIGKLFLTIYFYPCKVRAVSSVTSGAAKLHDLSAPILTSQTKYLELLARYYVRKGERIAAARMFLILAERQCSNSEEVPTLDKRSLDFEPLFCLLL